jgi:hypothetical protein
MRPSRDQIERAAYERWERRGRLHGFDREDWIAAETDLYYQLNYQTVAEYPLGECQERILGPQQRTRCRFCEQSAPRASFSVVRPVVPETVCNSSLFTRDVCDECAEQFADSIDQEFSRFWNSLEVLRSGDVSFREIRVPGAITVAAFKSLIRMALCIVPEAELAGFTDTIEWVCNQDHEFDSRLLHGMGCLVYQTHVPFSLGWTCLARRTEEDAPIPYMLFFLASDRLILQTHLPLCTRDEDLDGGETNVPEQSFSTGFGSDYRPSTCMVLPLKAADQAKPRRFRLFW